MAPTSMINDGMRGEIRRRSPLSYANFFHSARIMPGNPSQSTRFFGIGFAYNQSGGLLSPRRFPRETERPYGHYCPAMGELFAMKTTLLVICVLLTTAAMGQVAGTVLSSQPTVVTPPSHPQHAYQTGLGLEQGILERSHIVVAHGERPLWDISLPSESKPLGDEARVLKREHESAKKAVIVWEN